MAELTKMEESAVSAKKNFIDFILATEKDENLLAEFLKCKSSEDLQALFKPEYTVTPEDCEKLIRAKKNLNIEDGVIPPAY